MLLRLAYLGVTNAVDGLGDSARCEDRSVPERVATTWAQFPRSQAEALLAVDFLETITLTGTRMYVLAMPG